MNKLISFSDFLSEKKKKKKENKRSGFDRGINPHDGSRRRLSSQPHKSPNKYNRKKKHKNIKEE